MSDYDENKMAEYAKLSDGAYGVKDVDGYDVDNELSNSNRTVYVKDGKAVVSFRGTDLSSKKNKWKDLGNDALIAVGLQDLSSRFRKSNQITNKAIEKYGKENVSLTGHSLGGSQALYVHTKTGLDTHAFNAGISPLDVRRSGGQFTPERVLSLFKKPKYSDNAHSYVTRNDLVGGLSPLIKGLNTHIVGQKDRNAHSLKNFFR
jgi:hypothetical protein